ncbi:MAG: signal peptidase II [Calditrichaeota bacterium]|nr:MAG: signal peptidase II [Calditrichota bacterium]
MRILLLSVVVVALDQISKWSVKLFFEYGQPHRLIGDWVRLTYIENPGMAFGIQVGGQKFFTVFAIVATAIIFVYIVRARGEKMPIRLALALILGGAIGNLIDRLLYGKVVDFVDLGVGSTRWPIFNLADSAVTIGMIILITIVLFDRSPKDTVEEEEVASENRVYS